MIKAVIGASVVVVYILMVMGNVVTTTGSGLACPDWPLCHGTVAPPLEISIWFEWGHRLLGGTAGLLVLSSAIVVWLNFTGRLRWLTSSALGLLVVGVIFGGIIVLIEAPMLKETLHLLIISFHILLATIIFALMILAYRSLPGPALEEDGKFYLYMFGLVFLQVMIGIFVRYGKAGLACGPDFPLCMGYLIPPFNTFEVTIHYVHRLVATAIFFYALWHMIDVIKKGYDSKKAIITFALILTQASFGIALVLTGMFLPFIILHGANGFLLLGWLVYRSAPYLVSAEPATITDELEIA